MEAGDLAAWTIPPCQIKICIPDGRRRCDNGRALPPQVYGSNVPLSPWERQRQLEGLRLLGEMVGDASGVVAA